MLTQGGKAEDGRAVPLLAKQLEPQDASLLDLRGN